MITTWNEWHEDSQIEPTIVTAPTTQDISGTGLYTQNYPYQGYGLEFLESTRNLLGGGLPSGVSESPAYGLPVSFCLEQNYPNPFNPSTTIVFSLPHSGRVRMTIFDLLGQAVKTLIDDSQPAGKAEVTWNGTDNANRPVAAGIYFCRLEMDSLVRLRKLILIK